MGLGLSFEDNVFFGSAFRADRTPHPGFLIGLDNKGNGWVVDPASQYVWDSQTGRIDGKLLFLDIFFHLGLSDILGKDITFILNRGLLQNQPDSAMVIPARFFIPTPAGSKRAI